MARRNASLASGPLSCAKKIVPDCTMSPLPAQRCRSLLFLLARQLPVLCRGRRRRFAFGRGCDSSTGAITGAGAVLTAPSVQFRQSAGQCWHGILLLLVKMRQLCRCQCFSIEAELAPEFSAGIWLAVSKFAAKIECGRSFEIGNFCFGLFYFYFRKRV